MIFKVTSSGLGLGLPLRKLDRVDLNAQHFSCDSEVAGSPAARSHAQRGTVRTVFFLSPPGAELRPFPRPWGPGHLRHHLPWGRAVAILLGPLPLSRCRPLSALTGQAGLLSCSPVGALASPAGSGILQRERGHREGRALVQAPTAGSGRSGPETQASAPCLCSSSRTAACFWSAHSARPGPVPCTGFLGVPGLALPRVLRALHQLGGGEGGAGGSWLLSGLLHS